MVCVCVSLCTLLVVVADFWISAKQSLPLGSAYIVNDLLCACVRACARVRVRACVRVRV